MPPNYMTARWSARPKTNKAWYRKTDDDKWALRPAARRRLVAKRRRINKAKAMRAAKVKGILAQREQAAAWDRDHPVGPYEFEPNVFDEYGYQIKKRGPKAGQNQYVVSVGGQPIWQGGYPDPQNLPQEVINALYKRYGVNPNNPYIEYPSFARRRLNFMDAAKQQHMSYAQDVQKWLTGALSNVTNTQRQISAAYEQSAKALPQIGSVVAAGNAQTPGGPAAINRADVQAVANQGQAAVDAAQGEAAINRAISDTTIALGQKGSEAGMARAISEIPYYYDQQKLEYIDNIERFIQEIEMQEAQLEQAQGQFDAELGFRREELGFRREELGALNERHDKDIALGTLQAQYGLLGDLTSAGIQARGQQFERQIARSQLDLERARLRADLQAGETPQGTVGPITSRGKPKTPGYQWFPAPGRNKWYGIPIEEAGAPEVPRGTGGFFIPGEQRPAPIPGYALRQEPGGWRYVPKRGGGPGGARGGGRVSPSEKRQRLKDARTIWHGGTIIDPQTGVITQRISTGLKDQNAKTPTKVQSLLNQVIAMGIGKVEARRIVRAVVGKNAFRQWAIASKRGTVPG